MEDLLDHVEEVQEQEQEHSNNEITLPALVVQVSGQVIASNLEDYKSVAMQIIGSVNTNLKTDDDFAMAEESIKWCKSVETKLQKVKDDAIKQTASINAVFCAIDEISEYAREKRLELSKLTKTAKELKRKEIIVNVKTAFNEHLANANKALGVVQLPFIAFDVETAMKNKRTIESLNKAATKELEQAKANIDTLLDKYQANLNLIKEHGSQWPMLFVDKQSLVQKDGAELLATINSRISAHQAQQEAQRLLEEQKTQQRELEAQKREAENLARQKEQQAINDAKAKENVRQRPLPAFEANPETKRSMETLKPMGVSKAHSVNEGQDVAKPSSLIAVNEFVAQQKEKLDSFMSQWLENQLLSGVTDWPDELSESDWQERFRLLDSAGLL